LRQDVHIIGAGPAGCITAINALKAGYDVLISEEHGPEDFGRKSCSGLFSISGLETLKKYINYKKFIINEIRGANIFFNDVLFKVRRNEPVACVCDRAGFDKELATNAESIGVKIFYNERIKGQFRSKNIIGADGANSVVAAHFGFPRICRYVITLQKIIEHRKEESDIVDVFLSSKIPGFFGWAIPQNEERVEIGVGVESPNNVREAWNYLLKINGVKAENPNGCVIPVEMRARAGKEICGKNIILVGDAAGQVKASTGGGVLFGAWCAEIAGRNATKPRWYDLEWRARFGHELVLHRKIRDYINNLDDRQLSEMGKRLNDLSINDYLEKYGDMDRPSKLIKPEILIYLLNVPGFCR